MNRKAIATLANGTTATGRLTTDHAASSYGKPVFVDDDGQAYSDIDLLHVADIEGDEPGEPPSKYQQAYDALVHYVPSAKAPHLDALSEAGLLDQLAVDQTVEIVRLMQAAYSKGQASTGAEVVDNDAIWVNGIGMIERQSNGSWALTAADKPAVSSAAVTLGSITSERKAAAVRENGKKGGRPRKQK